MVDWTSQVRERLGALRLHPGREAEIVEAMRFYWTRMKLVVEPSGAVPLAAAVTAFAAGEEGYDAASRAWNLPLLNCFLPYASVLLLVTTYVWPWNSRIMSMSQGSKSCCWST